MKPKKVTVYESYLVVEGTGDFPVDMLRYDHACPYREEDAAKLQSHRHERRRVALLRRSVNPSPATLGRWASFGWRVISETTDPGPAVDLTRPQVKP